MNFGIVLLTLLPPAHGPARTTVALHQQDAEYAPGADLVGPDDAGRDRRLAWADLMKRVFAADVLVCSRCGGDMRLVAVIEDPAVSEKILSHLGLWQRGPPRTRHVVVEPADHEPPYLA
jgi:hypothetical protein